MATSSSSGTFAALKALGLSAQAATKSADQLSTEQSAAIQDAAATVEALTDEDLADPEVMAAVATIRLRVSQLLEDQPDPSPGENHATAAAVKENPLAGQYDVYGRRVQPQQRQDGALKQGPTLEGEYDRWGRRNRDH